MWQEELDWNKELVERYLGREVWSFLVLKKNN